MYSYIIVFMTLFHRYTSKERAQIGKYANVHGAAAAARYFSRKMKHPVQESTVKSIQKAFREETNRRRRRGDANPITILPQKKRGRGLLLGEELDTKLQLYLKTVRSNGGPVTARIAMAAAKGLLLAHNRHKLIEYGGYIQLNRAWAYALFKRMNFVLRKPTTSKSKNSIKDFQQIKKTFLQEVKTTVEMEDIPPELILNWDQTGIKIVPTTTWTMERRGTKRVEVIGTSDKRQVTAVFCGTIQGVFLPLQVVYAGKTARCHPKFKFPPGWHITHAPKHWSTEETMHQYIEHVILPYVHSVREALFEETTPGLVIMDNFKGQVTANINSFLEENHLHVCLIPPNTTDLLQPMDVSVNKPAKSFLKNKFSAWYAEQLLEQLEANGDVPLDQVELDPIDLSLPVLKELGARWMVEMAKYIEDNPQFIVNGFIKAGISRTLDSDDSSSEPDEQDRSDHSSESDDSSEYSDPEDVSNMEEDVTGSVSPLATDKEIIILSD